MQPFDLISMVVVYRLSTTLTVNDAAACVRASDFKSSTLGPSIFIVTDGEGQGGTADGGVLRLVKGTVFYISANEDVTVAAGAAGLVIHRAFCELA